MLDAETRRRHKIRNTAQAVLLLGGMVAVLAGVVWFLFGTVALLVALVVGGIVTLLRPTVPAQWILSMYGARPIPPSAMPWLYRDLALLAERARLPATPALYYVASPMMNAFTVGRRDDCAIAVTDGLLRGLSGRELVGVLAHEISHVRSDDMRVMSLSDTVGRLTQALSYLGMILLILTLPLTTRGEYTPLWIGAVLIVLPMVVTLLQLGLSRSREYDADLEAAVLTGDPDGLASALVRLERSDGRIWERLMVPRRRAPDPLLLRTHPPTQERVRRLRELTPPHDRHRLGDDHGGIPLGWYPPVTSPVRLRFPGVRW